MARKRPHVSAFRAWNCSTSFATSASRRAAATPTSARLISTQSTPTRRNGSKLSLVDSTASTSSARRRISASVSARVISFSSSSSSAGGADAGSGAGSVAGGFGSDGWTARTRRLSPGVSRRDPRVPIPQVPIPSSSRPGGGIRAAAETVSFGASLRRRSRALGFLHQPSNAAKRSASALGPGKFSSSTRAIAARAATTNGSSRAGVGTMRFRIPNSSVSARASTPTPTPALGSSARPSAASPYRARTGSP